nr:MAG TPA: hypothetical protein [Caudoviricetes sp.]
MSISKLVDFIMLLVTIILQQRIITQNMEQL